MKEGYQCLNCRRLGHCTETDETKILAGYYCNLWEEAPEGVHDARLHIIRLCGRSGVQAVISKDLKKED